jgi:dipeptidase E
VHPRAHLFLNGGGDAPESAPVDRAFVSALGDGPVLYWPFARPVDTHASCQAWFTELMSGLGVTRIEMWSHPEPARPLARYGGLYIGGGDTYRLFTTLRASGLDRLLADAIDGGLPVFGGSAGAIILGADIATWVPEGAERPSVETARGLDVLDGFSVWAEYEPHHEAAIQAWLASRRSPLLGLACAAGIIAKSGAMYACGREPVVRIDASGIAEFADGDLIAGRPASGR